MKNLIRSLFAIIIVLGLVSFISNNTKESGIKKSSMISLLQSSKAYTLEVASMMDASDYSFKPTDSVKTFGEQLAHVGMSSQLLTKMFIKGETVNFDPVAGDKMEKEMGASKEAVIKQLNETFDEIIATLEAMSDDQLQETFVFNFAPNKPELTKAEGILFIRDHVTHHRGQAITYLRIKGHTPPAYRPF